MLQCEKPLDSVDIGVVVGGLTDDATSSMGVVDESVAEFSVERGLGDFDFFFPLAFGVDVKLPFGVAATGVTCLVGASCPAGDSFGALLGSTGGVLRLKRNLGRRKRNATVIKQAAVATPHTNEGTDDPLDRAD